MDKFLGKKFVGYKRQKAVYKLLKEKHGYITNAFHRKDIGSIALIWGNKTIGLAHIVNRRTQEKMDIKEFLSDISDVIEKGTISKGRLARFEILHRGKIAVIAPEIYENKLTFLLTAFKTRKK